MRGAVPPAPLFIKGQGRGSAAPFHPIQPVEVKENGAVDSPHRSIEGTWESTHARARLSTSRAPVILSTLCMQQMWHNRQAQWDAWSDGSQARAVNGKRPCSLQETRKPPLYCPPQGDARMPTSCACTTPTSRVQRESWGSATDGIVAAVKIRPNCPRIVLGLAQQRAALMCGPGPGGPVGVQK